MSKSTTEPEARSLGNLYAEIKRVLNKVPDQPDRLEKCEQDSSKLVSMRFQPDTIKNVEFLKSVTGVENRTQLTADAIALAVWYVVKRSLGAEIYAEFPDGKREKMVVPGLEANQEEDENRTIQIQ